MEKKIIFNGVPYHLVSHQRYYLSYSTTNQGRKKPKGLHVALWEHHNNQTVPKGFLIHHKDGDYTNNDPSNLECISKEDHFEIHREERRQANKSPEHLEHLNRIRGKASEWHRSEEGRAWHSMNSKKHSSKIFKPREIICTECHKPFETKKPGRTYACQNCKNTRGDRVRKLIPIKCVVCEKEFKTKSHGKRTKKTCSSLCKSKLIFRNGGGLKNRIIYKSGKFVFKQSD